MAEENERVVLSPPRPSVSPAKPWSSFHSTLTLPSRVPGPGSPVRQQTPSLEVRNSPDLRQEPPAIVEEFKKHFSTLDLLIEYKLLYLNRPKGVYMLPSSKSLYEWHGVIFVHSGPYNTGIFHFTMYIPDGFPHQRPMVRFQSQVFHPYIHQSNGGFPPWEPSVHHLWHVVQFVADCFYKEETWQECEAVEFARRAQLSVLESLKNVYDHSDAEDGNFVRFKEMSEEKFQDAFVVMVAGELPKPPLEKSKPTAGSVVSNVTEQVKQIWERMGIS